MVNWRKTSPQMKWPMGEYTLIEGDKKFVKLEEIDSYKYLGVTIRLRGSMFSYHMKNSITKAKRIGGQVRIFCRGSVNRAYCARIGWERVSTPAIVYRCEVMLWTKSFEQELEQEQSKMERFITGALSKCPLWGIQGEIGWAPMSAKIAKAKLNYTRKLQFRKHSSCIFSVLFVQSSTQRKVLQSSIAFFLPSHLSCKVFPSISENLQQSNPCNNDPLPLLQSLLQRWSRLREPRVSCCI